MHLKDDPLFRITIPSKTQAYLAAGRPIIMAVRGDAADLVVRSGAGILAQPDDPASIADAVRQLVELPEPERVRMGNAGREFYEAELTLDRAARKLDAVFHEARRIPLKDGELWKAYSGKRMLDVALACAGILMTLPLCIAIAALIRVCMGSPVFFRQKRAGFHGEVFEILKFRSMRDVRGPDGVPLPDPERATRLGNFLRKTSLDELPELINVLRGEMSIVGPRPLVASYLARYTPIQAHRHDVLPGITGLAQVMGRQEITFSERIQFDLWYIRHCGFSLDLAILMRTVVQVLFGRGVRLNQDLREVDDLPPVRSAAENSSPEADLARLAEAVSRNRGAAPGQWICRRCAMPERRRRESQDASLACPGCGSRRVYRSRKRGWIERLAGMVGANPQRCHECNARYLGLGGRLFRFGFLQGAAKNIFLTVTMAAAVLFILAAILYFSRAQAAAGDASLTVLAARCFQV